jgi:Uma2 family endonuclease
MVAHSVRYAYEEYVRLADQSNVKLEWFRGQIFAMGGGTVAHAGLQAQVIAALVAQLRRGPCRVFTSELRVHVVAADVATYPDVTVICGPRAIDPADRNAVVDATALVEVLSPSTEEYDRGAKFDAFKRLPSLRHYMLVAQDERRVEVWTREGSDGWVCTVARDGETASLEAISATLDVRELYDGAAPPE